MIGGEFTDMTLSNQAEAEVEVFERVAGNGAAVYDSATELAAKTTGFKAELTDLHKRMKTGINDLGGTQVHNNAATQELSSSVERLRAFGEGNGVLTAAVQGGTAALEQFEGNTGSLTTVGEKLTKIYEHIGAVLGLFDEMPSLDKVQINSQEATDTVKKHAAAIQGWVDAGKQQQ